VGVCRVCPNSDKIYLTVVTFRFLLLFFAFVEKRDSFLPSGSWIVLFWLPAESKTTPGNNNSELGVLPPEPNQKNDANESIGPRDGNKVRGTGKLSRLV